jgi:hypothetical protein
MLLTVRHAASLLNYWSPQTRSSIRARNGEFLIDRNELRLKKSYPVISCAAIRRSTNEDKNVARGRPLDGERCLGVRHTVDVNHGGNLCRRFSMFCGARTDKNRRKLTKFVSEAEMLVTSSSPPPPVLLAGDKTRVVGTCWIAEAPVIKWEITKLFFSVCKKSHVIMSQKKRSPTSQSYRGIRTTQSSREL